MNTDDAAIVQSLAEQIIIRKAEIEIEFKCDVTMEREYVKQR